FVFERFYAQDAEARVDGTAFARAVESQAGYLAVPNADFGRFAIVPGLDNGISGLFRGELKGFRILFAGSPNESGCRSVVRVRAVNANCLRFEADLSGGLLANRGGKRFVVIHQVERNYSERFIVRTCDNECGRIDVVSDSFPIALEVVTQPSE